MKAIANSKKSRNIDGTIIHHLIGSGETNEDFRTVTQNANRSDPSLLSCSYCWIWDAKFENTYSAQSTDAKHARGVDGFYIVAL